MKYLIFSLCRSSHSIHAIALERMCFRKIHCWFPSVRIINCNAKNLRLRRSHLRLFRKKNKGLSAFYQCFSSLSLLDYVLFNEGWWTTECKISDVLCPGTSWAATIVSLWLARPHGASDCKEGGTFVCPSASHGWVEHTRTALMYPSLHDSDMTSQECRPCIFCHLPHQWWKCHLSPVTPVACFRLPL